MKFTQLSAVAALSMALSAVASPLPAPHGADKRSIQDKRIVIWKDGDATEAPTEAKRYVIPPHDDDSTTAVDKRIVLWDDATEGPTTEAVEKRYVLKWDDSVDTVEKRYVLKWDDSVDTVDKRSLDTVDKRYEIKWGWVDEADETEEIGSKAKRIVLWDDSVEGESAVDKRYVLKWDDSVDTVEKRYVLPIYDDTTEVATEAKRYVLPPDDLDSASAVDKRYVLKWSDSTEGEAIAEKAKRYEIKWGWVDAADETEEVGSKAKRIVIWDDATEEPTV